MSQHAIHIGECIRHLNELNRKHGSLREYVLSLFECNALEALQSEELSVLDRDEALLELRSLLKRVMGGTYFDFAEECLICYREMNGRGNVESFFAWMRLLACEPISIVTAWVHIRRLHPLILSGILKKPEHGGVYRDFDECIVPCINDFRRYGGEHKNQLFSAFGALMNKHFGEHR